MVRKVALCRRRPVACLLSLLIFMGTVHGGSETAARAQGSAAATEAAVAVIESAEYSGRVEGGMIVQGEFRMTVSRRGRGIVLLDWTDARLPIEDMNWERSPQDRAPVDWGTAPDGRVLVVIPEEPGVLTGKWSLQGVPFGTRTHFDLKLPQALTSTLELDVEDSLEVSARPGVAARSAEPVAAGRAAWKLDLGRSRQAIVFLGTGGAAGSSRGLRYESESLHLARRDGIFLQSELSIEIPAGSPRVTELGLRIPTTLEIQSMTLGSVPVSWTAGRSKGELVIPLSRVLPEGRVTLRIRGFQGIRWGRRRQVPFIQLSDGVLIRRGVAVRIEPPLRLLAADPEGLVQTSLSSDESAGELWRFEATRDDGRLFVEIDEPRSECLVTMNCLVDSRRPTAWTACHIQFTVENGSVFESRIRLPEDWRIVAVSPGDAESRIASWTMKDQLLALQWQNALTRNSPKQVVLSAYRSPLVIDRTASLDPPIALDTATQQSTVQVLPPEGTSLEVSEGESWRLDENRPVFPGLVADPDTAVRLRNPGTLRPVTLEGRGSSPGTRLTVKPTLFAVEALTADESLPSTEGSGAALPESPTAEGTPGPATGDGIRPGTAVCRLSTSVGRPGGTALVHHAALSFEAPLDPSRIAARLPEECRLSSVTVDGEPVSVIRSGDGILFPRSSRSVRRIELTYVTSGGTGLLRSSYRVPLPAFDLPVRYFGWTVDLPESLRFDGVEIPGLFSESFHELESTRRLFGPLGRERTEPVFSPLFAENWAKLFPSDDASPIAGSRRRFHFQSPTIPDNVSFAVWDVSRTRGLAWVALLGCLLIGSGARLFRIDRMVQAAGVWICTLAFVSTVLPVAWGHICGGMLVGSLISVLIPRRIIGKNDFLSRDERSRVVPPTVAATALLLVFDAAFRSPVEAQEPAPTTVAVAGASRPMSLIRSARYRFDAGAADAVPVAQARFEVLLRRDGSPRLVELPFRNVVFPARSRCLVDGVAVPLIPSAAGDGVVIDLAGSEPERSSTAGEWIPAILELEFVPRAAPDGTLPGRASSLDCVIPKVVDTIVEFTASIADPDLASWGERSISSAGVRRWNLGATGALASRLPSPPAVTGLSATTTVDVSSLRFDGVTRVSGETGGLPEHLELDFPREFAIRSVTGPSVIDWFAAPVSDPSNRIVIRAQGEGKTPVAIAWSLPVPSSGDGSATIPPLPLWTSGRTRHLLGIANDPASETRLPDGHALRILGPEELQQNPDFARARPALAVSLTEPTAIPLTLRSRSPQRTATVDETVRINHRTLDWTASVTIDVDDIAVFQHAFPVDPDIEITSVVAGSDAKPAPLRHSRRGNVLDVYLPGGQIQERTLVIQGTKPITPDVWTPFPVLSLRQGTVGSSRLSIVDGTDWAIELETADGRKRTAPEPTSPANGIASGQGTTTEFAAGNPDRPIRFRMLIPPAAIRADVVDAVDRVQGADWELRSVFRLRPGDVSLRKAVFSIPADWEFVKVRPAHYRHAVSKNEQGTFVNVFVPDRDYSGTAITLMTRPGKETARILDSRREGPAPAAVSLPRAVNAVEESRILFLPETLNLNPVADPVAAADRTGLLEWVPSEWRQTVSRVESACVRITAAEIRFAPVKEETSWAIPRIELEETLIWGTGEATSYAVTGCRIRPERDTVVRVDANAGVEIVSVHTETGDPVEFRSGPDGVSIPVQVGGDPSGLLIHWRFDGREPKFPLLRYGDLVPERRVLAILPGPNRSIRSPDLTPISRLDAMFVRWRALLARLQDPNSPTLPVDGSTLSGIRECQRVAGVLMQDPLSAPTPEQFGEYRRLIEDWNEQRDRLAVAGDSEPGATITSAEDPIGELLSRGNLPPGARWYDLTGAKDPRIETRRASLRLPATSIVAGGVLLMAMLLWWRYSGRIARIRDRVAVDPAIGLALLGGVWWLWLSPSVLGILFLATAAAIRLWNVVRKSRWFATVLGSFRRIRSVG